MTSIIRDLFDEINKIKSSKGIDVVLPPLVFTVFNLIVDLKFAIFGAIVSSLCIIVYRAITKKNVLFAITGLLGVLLAALIAYLSDNASNFYLTKLFSGSILLLGLVSSVIFKFPLTMLLSHLSKNWPIKWYRRKDIYPAYLEVTYIWILFMVLRLMVISVFLVKANLIGITIINLLLGFPFTLTILSLSYIYGIKRLRNLNGPSVEEFLDKKNAPWLGQQKGF